MKARLFNPDDLIPVARLCRDGEIRLAVKTARDLCRVGKFPAVKISNEWMSTRAAVRSYFYKGANKAFRRLCA